MDVGTSSARAGVFSLDGILLGQASQPISVYRPNPGYAEQSSEEIWLA
ncbi:MAG: FGGY family carbohydrate kinase, partial [Gammaproteobacteria bacterium]